MKKPFSDSEKGFNLLSIGQVTNKISFIFMSDSREFKSRIRLQSTIFHRKTHYHKTISLAVLLLEKKVPQADEVKKAKAPIFQKIM